MGREWCFDEVVDQNVISNSKRSMSILFADDVRLDINLLTSTLEYLNLEEVPFPGSKACWLSTLLKVDCTGIRSPIGRMHFYNGLSQSHAPRPSPLRSHLNVSEPKLIVPTCNIYQD
jgi:hypothetical protein